MGASLTVLWWLVEEQGTKGIDDSGSRNAEWNSRTGQLVDWSKGRSRAVDSERSWKRPILPLLVPFLNLYVYPTVSLWWFQLKQAQLIDKYKEKTQYNK